MTHPAVNFVAHQTGWFALVLSAAAQRSWLGILVGLGIIALHLARHRSEAPLVAGAVAWGLAAESTLLGPGLLQYASKNPGPAWLAPIWILVLWALFATTLQHSMKWLLGRPALAGLLGATLGPLAFRAGEGLGAVQFAPLRWTTYLGLAAVWGVSLPVLALMARRRPEGPPKVME
ncbi:MAG: DUF2878 domain-containing protein [Gemmatimonadales bacterium]